MKYEDVKIGMRVRYHGETGVIGDCAGTVEGLYPPLDPDDVGAVTMRPDALPNPWPYIGYDVFAPWVNTLTPCK